MNHRGTTGTGRASTAAAASSADVLESQNEAMLTTLQSKISTLKNVMKAKIDLICFETRHVSSVLPSLHSIP